MSKYRIERHNLDGRGNRRVRVYDMPLGPPIRLWPDHRPHPTDREYWRAVTDVPCPRNGCKGTIRWAEPGYVPGYRICDGCGRHFLAQGRSDSPKLLLVAGTRGGPKHAAAQADHRR